MNDALVFDIEGVMERVDNDRELLSELVEIFSKESQGMIETIRVAAETKNAPALDASAHSIKSALGNIGAMAAHGIAYRLEMAGKRNELTGVDATFKEFLSAIEAFQAAYQDFIASR